MPSVRARTPVAGGVPSMRVKIYAAATAYPAGESNDRKTVWGSKFTADTTLYRTVDDGATWTSVHAFDQPVVAAVEAPDGEVLAFTTNGSSSPSYIWKSAGYAASPTGATWTKVHTTTGGQIQSQFSANSFTFGNDKVRAGTGAIGVVAEYGGQTTGSGDQTSKGRRVYLTRDTGASWTQIFDLYTYFGNAVNMHVHGVAVDPWWNCVWILFGDAQQNSPKVDILRYDLDTGAITQLDAPTEWSGLSPFQMTTVAPLEDCVVFGPDNSIGPVRMARRGFRDAGPLQFVHVQIGRSGSGQVHYGIHRNRDQAGAPLLMGDASVSQVRSPGIALTYDGAHFYDIWNDPTLSPSDNLYTGPVRVYGPTYNGSILARVTTDAGGTSKLLVGEIVAAEPNVMDYIGQFTGDGTTTVFNIPHGLGYIPPKRAAWAASAAAATGTWTLTADATNLIVTFAAAPANTASVRIGAYAA